ncbi:zinc-binding alcohol dehydrogenase family protein [Acrocarpospora catenulata]|uniref:zinc-binding alcohol dehydrogenase family protein n=1 Tax=Acrocarpospora catenulata TaxID=2836182 RepID=UPI001BD9B737|nr:zinc-binding alcohol dehydrogenase family protein [Acrocarpospora catenulata]
MADMMRVVGFRENVAVDAEMPIPSPEGHDLLVRIEAVSVNPLDVIERARRSAKPELGILGYDAAGVVEAVGGQAALFQPGDEVYYAGSIARPGTNTEYHLVDERVVGRKPAGLDFAAAAALPLTTITAWETLHDRFRLAREATGTMVVVGAAGGVGSMLLQLARQQFPDLTLIGTASRPESRAWAEEMGAHHVVDHHGDLAAAVLEIAPQGVEYVFSPYSAGKLTAYATMLKPFGQVTALDQVDARASELFAKSLTWHWEMMFSRPLYAPGDTTHHDLLNVVAELVDAGQLRGTMTKRLGPIGAATLAEAHQLMESARSIGKVVVAGW